ncbi:MAG: NAD-dependent epimerase/dehydratase family protein [Desulfovibrionaceae bacterium]|nr:NAD-dependent epimerase/dehydratase family protein [Desulfovibrionaceae bacterium]
MNTIVFGGSGFLGSHVADALTDAGHEVTIFDRRPSPHLRANQRMIVGDILDRDLVAESLRGMDHAYNFAGVADLDDASTQPLQTIAQNIMGNATILEGARLAGIKRFLYASTIYVHSEKGGFYRCSKQAAELYVEQYQRDYGLDYTVLRYGTIYGPRSDERNSIHRYLKQALTGNRILAMGTGEERRNYIHVRDAARLSVKALEERFANCPLTLVGHQTMRFTDLFLMIREIMGDKGLTFDLSGSSNGAHYTMTPYSYKPSSGFNLTSDVNIDFGQGLIECLAAIEAGENAGAADEPAACGCRPPCGPDREGCK